MEIKVGKNYKITSDAYEWMTRRKKINKKTNEKTWEILGHYTSFANALEGLAEYKVRIIPDSDPAKIRAQIEDVYLECQKAVGMFAKLCRERS